MKMYVIERYAPRDWPLVADLIRKWPFKPFRNHDLWHADHLENLSLTRVNEILKNPHVTAWVARHINKIVGFVTLTPLPWDSEQLGLPAARLDYLIAHGTYNEELSIKENLIKSVLYFCSKEGVKHLSVRVDASDLSSIHVLEKLGFIMVDGILTFATKLNGNMPFILKEKIEKITTRVAEPSDSEAVAELARKSFIYDRFHSDPAIPKELADELHANWLRNSCSGKVADVVILAEDNQGILGFVTCKLQKDTRKYLGKMVGTIVLIATAKRARRKGVGRALTLAALDWFRQQGSDIVEVGTQLRNIPASRLYEGCGFRIVSSSVSLRRLIL